MDGRLRLADDNCYTQNGWTDKVLLKEQLRYYSHCPGINLNGKEKVYMCITLSK